MSHDLSHIYKDAPYGISTDDVSYVLGETSGDVGTLCTSNSINKYAKYKPCGGSSPASPTEAERKQLNCGIDTSNLVFSSFGDCLTAAKANCDWSKVTPVWYRLADFDKYYHGARQPYYGQIDIVGNTVLGGTSGMYIQLEIRHNVDMFQNVKINMQLSDLLGMLEENYNLDQYRYAFIYRDASNPSATVNMVDIPLSTGETIADANNKSINVTFAMPSGSTYQSVITYDCVFVAYAYDDGVADNMVFLPKTYFQVKLALFGIWNSSGVSIENTTIQIPKAGTGENPIALIFSGYEWDALVMGNLIPASFTPSQGDSQSSWKNVSLSVGEATERRVERKVTSLVYVSAPGRVGTTGDFTKQFYLEQACDPPVSTYNIEIWYRGEKVNQMDFPTTGGVQRNIDIVYDCAWRVERIYDFDTDEDVSFIQFSPSSRPAPAPNPGWAKYEDGYILNTTALQAGKTYAIEFRTNDGSDVPIDTFFINVVSET